VPLVLALEPDLRQAAILKRVIKREVRAELVLVDSRDAAIAALSARVPDVVLLTALLSPRDEEELIAHLRSLAGAEHLQTHTIPQLASSPASDDGRAAGGGLLGKFRRKKEAQPMPGCDPTLFATEVRAFLDRAEELKSESAPPLVLRAAEPEDDVAAARMEEPPARVEEAPPAAPTTWASPFEWRGSVPLRGQAPIEEPAAVQELTATVLRQDRPAEEQKEQAPREEPAQPVMPVQKPALLLEPEEPARVEDFTPPVTVEDFTPPVTVEDYTPPPQAEEPTAWLTEIEAEPLLPAQDEPRPEAVTAAAPVQEVTEDEAPQTESRRDPFAAFREDADEERAGMLRFLPLSLWARRELPKVPAPPQAEPGGEVRALLSSLALSPYVAGVTFPRGCRIRRVRVPATPRTRAAHPVIVSRRTLEEMRAAERR